MAYLYLKVLSRALDASTPASERRAAGRFLHGLAGDWRTDEVRSPREPLLGDLIRAALHHRIDGE